MAATRRAARISSPVISLVDWEEHLAMGSHEEPVALRSVAPVFSTTNVARWMENYRGLGFQVEPHDDAYGFAQLGPVHVHVHVTTSTIH